MKPLNNTYPKWQRRLSLALTHIGQKENRLRSTLSTPAAKAFSIDYGIMEKAANVDVVLGQDFGWSDLGTWGSLYEQMHEERGSNVVLGDQVNVYDSTDSMIMIPKDKLAVIQGLSNYIVIDTEDALLICQKDEEQKIKKFVEDLKSQGKKKFL